MRKRKYTSLSTSEPLQDNLPMPVVHNIVATAQINCSMPKLDLEKIRRLLPYSFYDKNKFAAITIQLSNPECTILLFSSGKLVVTGGRTWFESVYSSLCIARCVITFV